MTSFRSNIITQPPLWMRRLYGDAFWRGDITKKSVYLTFDDGPVPHPTPWVLEQLEKYDVKATFFCVGENRRKHPSLFQMIVDAGHSVGNHTYHHTQAYRVNRKTYFDEVELGNKDLNTNLFRPPHGQLYPWYVKPLKQHYEKIVMWDVMSQDYNQQLNGWQVLKNVTNFVRPGSVIVFHDSIKAFDRLKIALPNTIEYLLGNGYDFKKL